MAELVSDVLILEAYFYFLFFVIIVFSFVVSNKDKGHLSVCLSACVTRGCDVVD